MIKKHDFNQIKTLDKLLTYLHSLHPKLIDFNLNRIKNLLTKLGNPEKKLPLVIHIAGTNGKGSSLAFIKAIAESYGLNVNCYISPHIIKFNERIIINGKLIEDDFLFQNLYEVARTNNHEEITFFEITTAACFLAFSKTQSDICLIETGLGGRLDATNVVENKKITILTKIGYDHVEFLGKSLKKITLEKCGIIKENTPVIIGKQNKPIVKKIIVEEAQKKKSQILPLHKIPKKWPLGLLGNHQYENAEIAVTAMKYLFKDLRKQIIQEGLKSVNWPGRLQQIENGKLFKKRKNITIIDGAHNLDGANMLLNYFKKINFNNWVIVLGMMKNKDVQGFVELLKKYIDTILVIPIKGQKLCFTERELEKILRIKCQIYPKPFKSIEKALKHVCPEKPLLVTGSLYLMGEILKKN